MGLMEWLHYFNNNLLLPILLSLISAIIFWVAFNYFPRQKRHRKIRPKVEFDLFQMQTELAVYFYELFRVSPWRGVENQHEINAGRLTKEDIEVWLQDKCLNEAYKFDVNRDKLISIGSNLEKVAIRYSNSLSKLINFIEYLTTEEILLLQKIEYKLFTYDYHGIAEINIGGRKLYPINPNLSYMTEHIYDLYQLFLKLRLKVIEYKQIDRSINRHILPNLKLTKATDYYYCGEYSKCLRIIKKVKNAECNWLLFQCLMKLGKNKEGYNTLREALASTHLELVSLRTSLNPFILEDEQVQRICREMRSESELKYCLKTIHEENGLRTNHEKQNLMLRNYYKDELNGSIAKSKEEYERMKENL